MAWEHRDCGSIVESGKNPPFDCDFCTGLLVKVAKGGDQGWRRVAGEHWPPAPRSPKAKKKADAKERKRKRRRAKIGRKKRERIYERDGWKCVRCGNADKLQLTLDHIIPLARGGGDEDENLQTMCKHCNMLKGSKTGSNGMRWPTQREMKRAGWIP